MEMVTNVSYNAYVSNASNLKKTKAINFTGGDVNELLNLIRKAIGAAMEAKYISIQPEGLIVGDACKSIGKALQENGDVPIEELIAALMK